MGKSVFFAKNMTELLYQLKTIKDIRIVGGCTRLHELPEKSISTHGIKELSQIVRHERYLDVGAGTSLSQLLELGLNHLPQVLYDALISIANPAVRNMATVGGNICAEGHKLTLCAPLMALDTRLEFRNQSDTLYEPFSGNMRIPDGFILSNVRIPYPDADISVFKRIGPEHSITAQSASFAFLAGMEKNSLSSVRLTFAGPFTFRSRELENSLIGKRIPLTQKSVSDIQSAVKAEFQKAAADQMISDVVRQQFFNLTRYSFEQLT